nr:Nucleoporin Nup43 [Polyrhizophydium stewartii]
MRGVAGFLRIVSRVRWAPLRSLRSGRSLLVAGTYDGRAPSVHLWSFDPQARQRLAEDGDEDMLAGVLESSDMATAATHQASAPAKANVTGLEFLEEGSTVVAALDDGHIRAFQIQGDAGGGAGGFRLSVVAENKVHERPDRHLAGCTALALSRASSDQHIASVGADGKIAFSTINGRILHTIRDVDSLSLTAVQWRTASQVATASLSGRICLYDQRASSAALVFSDHRVDVQPLHSLAVHPVRAEKLAVGSDSGLVQLWDLRNTSVPESIESQTHESIGEAKAANGVMMDTAADRTTLFRAAQQPLSINSFSIQSDSGALVAAGDAGQLLFTFV